MTIKYAVTVYFETKGHAEVIAKFVDDEVYGVAAPALEAWAKANGGIITETITEEA